MYYKHITVAVGGKGKKKKVWVEGTNRYPGQTKSRRQIHFSEYPPVHKDDMRCSLGYRGQLHGRSRNIGRLHNGESGK